MVSIVGVGPSGKNWMTKMGQKKVENAEVIIGAKRHIAVWATADMEVYYITKSLVDIVQIIKEKSEKRIVILASGEPTLYGIATYIRKQLKKENHIEVEVISGISSIQYFFSKIPLDMNDIYITSAHGKKVDFHQIEAMKKVAMVTDSIQNPNFIAKELVKLGSKKAMFIGEQLGYEEERIYSFTNLEEVKEQKEDKLYVVVVYEKEDV